MKQLAEGLYVGTVSEHLDLENEAWAIVSAAQTVHYPLLQWNWTTRKPDRNHPNYILYEQPRHLSLNWVDGPAHLYKWSGPATFIRVLDFVERELAAPRSVLIRCDQGMSRSPTLALLYLAKRLKTLPDTSFLDARAEFAKIYPSYHPSGIADYVSQVWTEIV
jgi:hypothetical protein